MHVEQVVVIMAECANSTPHREHLARHTQFSRVHVAQDAELWTTLSVFPWTNLGDFATTVDASKINDTTEAGRLA